MLRPDLTRIISCPPLGGPGVASKCICPYFIAAVSLNVNELHHDDVDIAIMAVTILQGKNRKAVSVARRCLDRRPFGNMSELETILNHKAEAYLGVADIKARDELILPPFGSQPSAMRERSNNLLRVLAVPIT